MFNSLPLKKVLDWSKFKAFADDKINVTKKLNFDLGRVENIVGKGENANYQHLSFFHNIFKRLYENTKKFKKTLAPYLKSSYFHPKSVSRFKK